VSLGEAAASNASTAERNRRTPLTRLIKSVYGSGALLDGMANGALGFLFFYMTAVRGLSGALAGLSMVIALIIDSVADPLIGSLSDGTTSRFGRRHPWMLLSALPLGLSVGLLFSAPASLDQAALFVWLTLSAIAVRISLSLFTIPHAALAAELSDGYVERSNVVAYRIAFGALAGVLAPALALIVFMPTTADLLHAGGYMPFAWSCAVVGFVSGVVCTIGTRGTLARLHVAEKKTDHPLLAFLRELGDILRHRHFVILFAGSLIYFASQGVAGQLGLHNAKFFWKFSNQTLQFLTTVGAVGSIAGFPVSAWLQRHFDKHILLVWTLVITCLASAVTPLLRLADILPAAGPGLLVPITVLRFLDGAAQVLIGITYYSMTADTADEHEYLFGARREGLFFAGLAFSSKAATAIGSFIAGQALDLIHFPGAIAAQGPALHIPYRTIVELALIAGPGSALMMATPAALVLLIRFKRSDLLRIQEELSARRKARTAGQLPDVVLENEGPVEPLRPLPATGAK